MSLLPPMNRRNALKATTALLGGALFTAEAVLTACSRESRTPGAAGETTPRVLSADDQALVEDIADTILPTTAVSPGAKAAGAGPAINLLLTDCYRPEAQRRVVQGLADFRAWCRARCGRGFASLSPSERERVLRDLDAEARKVGETHWFALVRQLSAQAYFSSEIGMTKALRYVQTPGRWLGCVPLQPGQPAWG